MAAALRAASRLAAARAFALAMSAWRFSWAAVTASLSARAPVVVESSEGLCGTIADALAPRASFATVVESAAEATTVPVTDRVPATPAAMLSCRGL